VALPWKLYAWVVLIAESKHKSSARGQRRLWPVPVEDAWQHPDDGIWFFDRAARVIQEFGMGEDEGQKMLLHICSLRDRIHMEVCERGFNPRMGAFTQSYGSEPLDASVLTIPYFGFLSSSDPRVQGTVAAIEKQRVCDGFVLRYDTRQEAAGLPGSEGAFLACTFWLADNYCFRLGCIGNSFAGASVFVLFRCPPRRQ
jgi:GH15 family glucan-1,4-alpha-glucosidase